MKKSHKFGIGSIVFGTLLGLSLVGATAGSLAWYAYSRRTYISFVGTSVAKSALLSVGIVDKHRTVDPSRYNTLGVKAETYDNQTILFNNSSKGLSVDAIREYLFYSDYAIDKLSPVTTQNRALNDQSDLTLYRAPEHGTPDITGFAEKKDYVKIPFAFKIIDDESATIPDQKVWLTEAVVQTSSDIAQSVRVYVEGTNRNFLMKPADTNTSPGKTKVGGLLDLDGDGTYDYNKGNSLEYAYGQFNVESKDDIPYSSTKYGVPEATAPYDNINGVTDLSKSTFYSKHNENAKTADLTNISPLYQNYETFGTVKPSVKPNGDFYVGDTGIPIASTSSSSHIGYATLTIFIEGWDHSVVDKAAGYSFNLGLRFEVNRI